MSIYSQIPGYIAGVTNPMFQQHDSWFDLLCVLDIPNERGTVQSAEERRIEEAVAKGKPHTAPSSPSAEEIAADVADCKFVARVISGAHAQFGELWIRNQFYEYTFGLMQQAFDIRYPEGEPALVENMNEKAKKRYRTCAHRASRLAASAELSGLPQSPWMWCGAAAVDGDPALLRTILRRMQTENRLPVEFVVRAFQLLDRALISELSCQCLLTLLLESNGGLHNVAVGLFAQHGEVRQHAVSIIAKLGETPSVKCFQESLNPFYLINCRPNKS
jgi:hypothetical protein